MGLFDYFNKKNDVEERSLHGGDGSALALTMLLGGGIKSRSIKINSNC